MYYGWVRSTPPLPPPGRDLKRLSKKHCIIEFWITKKTIFGNRSLTRGVVLRTNPTLQHHFFFNYALIRDDWKEKCITTWIFFYSGIWIRCWAPGARTARRAPAAASMLDRAPDQSRTRKLTGSIFTRF